MKHVNKMKVFVICIMFQFIDYHQSVLERPFMFTIYIEFHKNTVTPYFMMQSAFFSTILSLLLPL